MSLVMPPAPRSVKFSLGQGRGDDGRSRSVKIPEPGDEGGVEGIEAVHGELAAEDAACGDHSRPSALNAILPGSGRAAGALDRADIETLRHMAEKGIGENSLRAIQSDMAYIETWAIAATGERLPWPAPVDLLLKFVAHHLWDPAERARNPEHGMPEAVADVLRRGGFLRKVGPHKASTVRRRLSSWSTMSSWRNVEASFNAPPLRKALRLAARAHAAPRARKSEKAVTKEILGEILTPLDRIARATIKVGDRRDTAYLLKALRDRAMLSLAFAAGGRRRSEVAELQVDQIEWRKPIVEIDAAGNKQLVPACRIRLGRTKTTSSEEGFEIFVAGRAVEDLKAWIERGQIALGPVFRRIDRWGHVGAQAISPQTVNLVLKTRLAAVGLDPLEFSAHGIRAGYLTEAFRAGISLPEAMAQSGHRSVEQAARYYNEAGSAAGRAARLLE